MTNVIIAIRDTARGANLRTALVACLIALCEVAVLAQDVSQELTILGTIVSSDGVPLQGSVTIVEGTRDVRVNSYRTHANGAFSIPTVWASQKRVAAKADGFVSFEAVIPVGPGQREVTHKFTLKPATSVSGRVLDASGASVPGATVRVRYVGESRRTISFAQEVGAVTSDDFGYFVLPIIDRDKEFVLDVVSDGKPLSSSTTLAGRGSALTNVVITTSRSGYPVTGLVTDGSGQPVAGIRIRLVVSADLEGYSAEERASVSFTAAAARVVVTNALGRFAFAGIPSGKITIIVGSPQNRTRKEEVVNRGPLEISITLAQ